MANEILASQSNNCNLNAKFAIRLRKLGYGHLTQKLFKLGDGKIVEKLRGLGDEKLIAKLKKLVESKALEKLEKLGDEKLAEKLSQIKSKKTGKTPEKAGELSTSHGVKGDSTTADKDKLFVRTGASGKSRVSHFANFSLDKITEFLEKQKEILLHEQKEKEESASRPRRLSETDHNISLKKKPITPEEVDDDESFDSSEDELLEQDVVNMIERAREFKGLKQKKLYIPNSRRSQSPESNDDDIQFEHIEKRIKSRLKHRKHRREKHSKPNREVPVTKTDVAKVKTEPPKPKVKKIKHRHMRPPAEPVLGFSDILKLAQQKAQEPVKLAIPKRKEPERPLTQEEKERLERKQIREKKEKISGSDESDEKNSSLKVNRFSRDERSGPREDLIQRKNGQFRPNSAQEIQRKTEKKYSEQIQSKNSLSADRTRIYKDQSKISSHERPRTAISDKTGISTHEKKNSSVPLHNDKMSGKIASLQKSQNTSNHSSSPSRDRVKGLTSEKSFNKKPRLSLPEKSRTDFDKYSSSEKTDRSRHSLPGKYPRDINEKSVDISRNSHQPKHKHSSEKNVKNEPSTSRSWPGKISKSSTSGSNSPVIYHGENENVLVCGPGNTDSKKSASVSDSKPSNPFDRIYSQIKKSHPQPKKRRHAVVETDSEEDNDEEMDDFLAESDEDYTEGLDISKCIRSIFGYDKTKFRYESDREIANMESNFGQQMKEEKRSARLGLQEDLEDMKKEEELRRKKMLKKKNRR